MRLADKNKQAITIPDNLASLENINNSGASETIINIQDCHSSLSAQYSIVEILRNLMKNYDLNLVALEGGSGYIDTSVMNSFPYNDIKEKTLMYLMKEGTLSAGEFFGALEGGDKIILYGTEDNVLHEENVKYFRKIYSESARELGFIETLINFLDMKEKEIYPIAAREFVFKGRLYKKGKITLDVYWDAVLKAGETRGVKFSEFPNMNKYIFSVNLEKNINFQAVTNERKMLMDKLTKICGKGELEILLGKSIDFKKGEISESEFYKWFLNFSKEKGVVPAEYNNLKKYLEYIEYCRSIDIPRMQVEIENVEKILIPSLLGEPLAKRLYKLACFTRNLENLFKIQLAPGGAEDLSKNLNENLTEEYLFFLKDVFYHLEIKKPRDFENRMAVLLKQSKENLKFYEIAERRDKVILQNTIKAMRSEKKQVAALITGGHHSEGLTRLMKKEQLSYMVLMPKFEDGKSRPYAAILTRKSGRYKKIAENDGYNLAIKTYFDSDSMSGIQESLVFSLGASFFDGRNIDDTRRLWTANYEREYNAIPKIRRDAMNVSPIAPEIFKNELYKIKIKLLGNGETCEVKCGNNIYVLKKDSFEMSCVRAVSDSNFSVAVKQVFEKLNIFLALARKKINKYFIGIKGAILSVVFFTHELFLKGEYRDLFRSIFSKHVRVVFITVLTAFLIVAPSLKELLFFNMFKKEYSAEANEYSRDTTPRWVKMISIINFNSEYPYKIRDFFKGTRAFYHILKFFYNIKLKNKLFKNKQVY
ncbi:conserved hypothetical protein, membrane [Candidatus Omnitrophus magneticus]|uniref:Uncharacterized protein n=1 Tax=Candidatus Omnitrophus magneticus TaxID=1609969 RepID=A0A0F0CQI3_9BACT|nr:conserved hypothetical protein, membrane [Candidatus Omnitrophus magneticus]